MLKKSDKDEAVKYLRELKIEYLKYRDKLDPMLEMVLLSSIRYNYGISNPERFINQKITTMEQISDEKNAIKELEPDQETTTDQDKPKVEYKKNRTVLIDGNYYRELTIQEYYIVKVLDENPEGNDQRWVIGRALEKIEKVYPDKDIKKHKKIRDYFKNRKHYNLYKDHICKEKGLYFLKKN